MNTYLTGRWFVVSLALIAASCMDTASKNNDNTMSAAGASGGGAAGTGAAGAAAGAGAAGMIARAGSGGTGVAGAAAGSGGTSAPIGGMSADEDGGVATAGTTGEAGAPAASSGEAGAGTAGAPSTAPDPTLVMGTGTMCSSYGAPMNGKCGGYFCGVDQATLQKAVDPMALCGSDIDLLCRNAVITAVGTCARQVKSQMPLATNDELSPMVQDCVFQDAEIKMNTTPECLACTITAAECAGDQCLAQCLAGDSAQCDSCRKMNNCDQPVFACGGLPSPL
jgi:hypothetical protein